MTVCFTSTLENAEVIVVGKRCSVGGSDLNPLTDAGRHANGGEGHGNEQCCTHQCLHVLIVTIANKIGFDGLVLILQKSPFLIGDLRNSHIFCELVFTQIVL